MATAAIPASLDTRTDVFQLVQLHALNRTGAKSWLVQIYPAQSIGRLFNLTEGHVTLGRDERSSVTLDDAAVSRHHAKIETGRRSVRADRFGEPQRHLCE